MKKSIKDFEKIGSLPTDDLAHKLDINYDSAEALQRIVEKELENLRLNVGMENEEDQKYECWIVLNDSGHCFGNFDYTNGEFIGASDHCAYLNDKYPEFYTMVQIFEKEDQ